ncbi:MAG: 1,3-propanediol dehydrogenase [Verrucomicrobiota bacterium]|jgi:alcohol dehydrogenase class IV
MTTTSAPSPVHQFSFPTAISFGAGARRRVPEHLRTAQVKRPLVVTDQGVASLPMTGELMDGLRAAGLHPGLFGGVRGNPTAGQVGAGVAAYRVHDADGIVGLGGGAALDVAKAVALMTGHEGDVLEYAWDHPHVRAIKHALPWLIALPTTAGTGSEVGRSAVISHDITHVKKIIFSPALLPKAVFADPELSLGLPPHLTAATGMDALAHNVESYLSPAYHPLCDGIALEGARLAARALRVAVHEGRNLAARSDMLMSSLMGAVAFQKDLGAVHSCAHSLGTVLNLHHGLAIGVMFDHVMHFNELAAAVKMAELARVCGAGTTAGDFTAWLGQLKNDIGIPATLDPLGATLGHLARLVEVALADTCHRTNPRPCSRDDFEMLFRQALAK